MAIANNCTLVSTEENNFLPDSHWASHAWSRRCDYLIKQSTRVDWLDHSFHSFRGVSQALSFLVPPLYLHLPPAVKIIDKIKNNGNVKFYFKFNITFKQISRSRSFSSLEASSCPPNLGEHRGAELGGRINSEHVLRSRCHAGPWPYIVVPLLYIHDESLRKNTKVLP